MNVKLRKGLDTVESLSVEVKGSKILVKILPKGFCIEMWLIDFYLCRIYQN